MDGLVSDGVGDVLDRDAVVAHDRHGGVAPFVRVPVADPGSPSHLAEPPVERVPRVHSPVLVAEHEIAVVVCLARGFAFGGLAPLVRLQGKERALRQGKGALGFRRLDVAAPARRAPHVDHPGVQVHQIPGELAQLTGPQAYRDR